MGYASTIILAEDTSPITIMASLAHRYPEAKVIFSGGSASLIGTPSEEAASAKQLFVSFGIDASRILIEDKSRNTEENARFTASLLNPPRDSHWLLVTSAYHMPRAVGAFRKAGVQVIAFPVGWRTQGWRDLWWLPSSATENLRRVDVATKEWIGLTVYRILGYSSDWYPAATDYSHRQELNAPVRISG